MSYDSDIMARIAEDLYTVEVERVHGEVGTVRLQRVLKAVKELYLFRSPQSFPDGLVVFAALDAGSEPLNPDGSVELPNASGVADLSSGAVIEVLDNGALRVWPPGAAVPEDLAGAAVVYVFTPSAGGDSEAVALPAGRFTVPNPNGYPSALASPTFWNLEEALDYYATRLAARSTCKILKTVWAVDAEDRRLVLKNKPEVVMRESLTQHLRSSVRDAKLVRVNEEQNMSETEPVDIEVAWSMTSQIAVVEIKWMGKCLNEDSTRLASYSYSDGRAREGAGQLDGYLDDAYERNPGHELQGYLVVFDARRWAVTTWEPGPISREHAWYYKDREIDFQDSLPDRDEVQPPRRIFLEPKVAA